MKEGQEGKGKRKGRPQRPETTMGGGGRERLTKECRITNVCVVGVCDEEEREMFPVGRGAMI